MKAERMFKEYQNMKKELFVLEIQLKQFEGVDENDIITTMSLSHSNKEKVQTSNISDKTAKTAINYSKVAERINDDWFKFLLKRHKRIKEELDFFEYGINNLSNKLSEVIRDMVINEMQWKELMGKYNVCHATIGKYRKKAIIELNKAYEFHDIQTEAYILS